MSVKVHIYMPCPHFLNELGPFWWFTEKIGKFWHVNFNFPDFLGIKKEWVLHFSAS